MNTGSIALLATILDGTHLVSGQNVVHDVWTDAVHLRGAKLIVCLAVRSGGRCSSIGVVERCAASNPTQEINNISGRTALMDD